jgi:hypothetical protein
LAVLSHVEWVAAYFVRMEPENFFAGGLSVS